MFSPLFIVILMRDSYKHIYSDLFHYVYKIYINLKPCNSVINNYNRNKNSKYRGKKSVYGGQK